MIQEGTPTLQHYLREFISFCRHPVSFSGYSPVGLTWTRKTAFAVILPALAFIPTFLQNSFDADIHSPSTTDFSQFLNDPDLAGVSLGVAIPLLVLGAIVTTFLMALPEEVGFRLPLKVKKWAIVIGFTLAAFYLFPAIWALAGGGESIWAVVVTLAPVVLFIGMATTYRYIGTGLESFLSKNFNYYTWALVLAFSFMHVANPVDGVVGLRLDTIVYALCIIPSGLAFSYLRLRFGFWWGVLSHAVTNIIAISFISVFFY